MLWTVLVAIAHVFVQPLLHCRKASFNNYFDCIVAVDVYIHVCFNSPLRRCLALLY